MCLKPDDSRDATKEVLQNAVVPSSVAAKIPSDAITPTHSKERNTDYDWALLAGVALFQPLTPVWPIYAIVLARLLSTHLLLSLHWMFVDKDNYTHKLTKKQLLRERSEYLTAYYLHMYVQVALQLVFPSMFFSDNAIIGTCMMEALAMHIFFVEPVYYVVHRWLHVPSQMKTMHGFHHLSIQTLPTTSMVQNFHEHLVYIATFGPAFFVPFLVMGRQHWVAIGAYLVFFDIVNQFGHMNLAIRHWMWTGTYSPLKYLLYTPEFHQGHHSYFNANYALFMPIWDYLGGTAREYRKKQPVVLPKEQQDFVFIGHNGGLSHLLTIPEICIYKVYDDYKIYFPLRFEVLLMHLICMVTRVFASFYYCSRFCVANERIGRIIVLLRTPYDYITPSRYSGINQEIVQCMREEHKKHGTRYFGLGNLNKMKQVNDGGIDIANMVKEDSYLCDKNIRVWTGDTMTVASVYHQIADIPDLKEFYYIGAGGKVGTAVCELLVKNFPYMKIKIFSRTPQLKHTNISYSTDLSEMKDYRVVLVGKILSGRMYAKALLGHGDVKTRFILDYTVPALPIECLKKRPENIQHIRVGLLRSTVTNNSFLRGHYDYCMSHDENHIVPCHFGCLLNTVAGRETDEVGDIDQNNVERMWKMTRARGFDNIEIDYSYD
jgi:sterol desaturase/sphingolipid hydroxylase (fatty acid hydroxylase superfamily)